jgi:hypothetical protein
MRHRFGGSGENGVESNGNFLQIEPTSVTVVIRFNELSVSEPYVRFSSHTAPPLGA